MAVLPSAERDTERPRLAAPTAPEPTSLVPCWVQTPALLVQTHAAPALPLSAYPPTMAVLPSAETDTEVPCRAGSTAPVPCNFGPCCKNCARAGWEESSVAETRTISATRWRIFMGTLQRRHHPTRQSSWQFRRPRPRHPCVMSPVQTGTTALQLQFAEGPRKRGRDDTM